MAIKPIDLSALTQAVTDTETVDASVIALLQGFAAATQKAVADAIAADDVANQGTADAAKAAIDAVTARFVAANTTLSAAITANTPSAPSV